MKFTIDTNALAGALKIAPKDDKCARIASPSRSAGRGNTKRRGFSRRLVDSVAAFALECGAWY